MQSGFSFSRADAVASAVLVLILAGFPLAGCGEGDDANKGQPSGNRSGTNAGGNPFASDAPTGEQINLKPSQVSDLFDTPFSAMSTSRRTATRMQNGTQVRGIQQAHVLFSQSNNEWYAGIDGSTGKAVGAIKAGEFTFGAAAPTDTDISASFAILLNGEFFEGDYIMSPAETDPSKVILDGEVNHRNVTRANYSYAMLQYGSETGNAGRRFEMRDTNNSQAPAIADRSKAIDSKLATTSYHTDATDTDPDNWMGNIAWNDNHVTFESSSMFSTGRLRLGNKSNQEPDDIFNLDGSKPDDHNVMFSHGE